jgi:hypothetical protein
MVWRRHGFVTLVSRKSRLVSHEIHNSQEDFRKNFLRATSAELVFAKHGLLRGKLELHGMSQPPDPRARETLVFTLRALLGVNARAEILAWLLTHDSGHPAAIARSTGYFSKSIQLREALDEAMPALIRAGVAHELRSSRDQRGAHLIQSLLADLDSFLG